MGSMEQENARLREGLEILRAEYERNRAETESLRAMITTLLAAQSQPLSVRDGNLVVAPMTTVYDDGSHFLKPQGCTWGMPTSFEKEIRPLHAEASTVTSRVTPVPKPRYVGSDNPASKLQEECESKTFPGKRSLNQETPKLGSVPDVVKPPFEFSSHLQSLMSTHKVDQLEQEVGELRKEVSILRADLEKLTKLVSSPAVEKDSPRVQQELKQQHQLQPLRPPMPQEPPPVHQPLVITVPVRNEPYQPQHQHQPPQKAPRVEFDPIPITYAKLLPALLDRGLVKTKRPLLVPTKEYKADYSCAFHQGAIGHDEDHCFALKKTVHKLIQANILSFKGRTPVFQFSLPPDHGA